MATALVNIIGVVSGVVTIVGFIQSNLPSQNEAEGATIRVAVGVDGTDGLNEAGGNRPYVVGFNEVGDAIGLTENGDKIGSGQFVDMILDQNAAGEDHTKEQPTWLQFTQSGTDGICIAYISVTWEDGTHRGWYGDTAEACDMKWHASNIIVGDDGHKTKCMWLDSDHTEDTWLGGFQIHTEDFLKENDDYNKDSGHYCTYPAMKFVHEGDEFDGIGKRSFSEPNATEVRAERRRRAGLQKRSPGVSGQLIVSSDSQHSAKELCESATSYGPDFVSIPEGLYCDMGPKELYSLCSEKEKTKCFDLESKTVVDGKRGLKREYNKVHQWD
ncbi:hypothetical protein VKT23_014561 [Stygiomarasmius scandens]|uniref:Uncharacterized protein n=1 Tax=Marasmiellus scandens TaxID=2682957 RepID=A0ABR1J4X9_9AGAR